MFSSNMRERSHSLKDVNKWWIDGEKGGFIAKFLLTNPTLNNGEPVDRFIVEQNKGLFSHMNASIPQKLDSLPPSYIVDTCLNKIFVEELDSVDFSVSCNGLDHLANFERIRVFTLQTAAMNLRINESNWRNVLAEHQGAKNWVESVIKRSFLVDMQYARIWTDLRIWTVAKKLESRPFNPAEAIAVLNTLFPPYLEVLPNQNITLESVANHRATFFSYLAAAGPSSSDGIAAYIHGLNSPANERNWANVRKTLKEYLSLAGDLIQEGNGIRDVRDLAESVPKSSFENWGSMDARGPNSTPRHKKSTPHMRDLVHDRSTTDDSQRSVSFGDVTRSNNIPHTPVPQTPPTSSGPFKSSFARNSTSIESNSIVPLTPRLQSHPYYHHDQRVSSDKSAKNKNETDLRYTAAGSNWDSYMKKFGRTEASGKDSRLNKSFEVTHPSPEFVASGESPESFGRNSNSKGTVGPLLPTPKFPSSPFAQGFKNDSNVFRSGPENVAHATTASPVVPRDKSQQGTQSLPYRPRARPPIPITSSRALGAQNTGLIVGINQPTPAVTYLENSDPKAMSDPPVKKISGKFFGLGKKQGDKAAEVDMSGELPSFDRREDSIDGSPRSRKTLRKAQSGVSLRSAGIAADVGRGMFGKDFNFSKSAMSGEIMTREDTAEQPSNGSVTTGKPTSFFKRMKNSEGSSSDAGKRKERPLTDQLIGEVSAADNHEEYLQDMLLEKEREARKRRMKGEMRPPPTPVRDEGGASRHSAEETPKASRLERVIKNFAGSYSPAG